jgi:GT2 family glycosyltransferase
MRPALPWEVVVVDNGSRDATPRLLADFAARAPFPVTVVREPRPGLARARNAGVRAARAPLLVFVDDDCYPAPDLLDRYAELFADPGLGYAAGRILLYDPDDYPITIRTETDPEPIPAHGFVQPGVVQGANVAYRRAVVFALGGFDPALGPGGVFNFEDLDMASRATAAGHEAGTSRGRWSTTTTAAGAPPRCARSSARTTAAAARTTRACCSAGAPTGPWRGTTCAR